ncbi:MAG: response regulator transcription factor [Clostridia bacterium]|nr:response regulator transcription factor [Clostridia bacterium]
MIKILIADDQKLLRESLSYILESESDFKVVETVENGVEALRVCETYCPDIVLMDIEMPTLNGVNATEKLKKICPEIKVIILTTFENPDNIMEAFLAGADGYIVKSIDYKELIMTIRCVLSGLTVIDHSVKQIMLQRFKGLSDYKMKYEDLLSDKEVEIIKWIASGKSNREIAHILSYSEGTIKNNVSKILEKLKLTDRVQVAIFAIENGVV